MAYGLVSTSDVASAQYRAEAGPGGSLYLLQSIPNNALVRLNADGTTTKLVGSPGAPNLYYGDIDVLSDGRIVLSGIAFAGLGANTVAQVYGADGAPQSAVFDPGMVNGQVNSRGFTIAATQDGGFAFFYNDVTNGNQSYHATYPPRSDGIFETDIGGGVDATVRYFDADLVGATPVVTDTDVETINGGTVDRRAGDQYVYDATTLTGGSTVLAYLDQRFVGQNGGLSAEFVISVSITTKDGVGNRSRSTSAPLAAPSPNIWTAAPASACWPCPATSSR